jgi:hypothetical protein
LNWRQLREQLASEAREYLTDLRDLRDSLRSIEGWIALGLLLASLVMLGIFAYMAMGFSPNPNAEITSFIYRIGLRPCRELSNTSGVILFIDLFVLLFLVAVTMGCVLNMIGRVKRGEAREPRELITTASLMLVVGIGGIIYMSVIC